MDSINFLALTRSCCLSPSLFSVFQTIHASICMDTLLCCLYHTIPARLILFSWQWKNHHMQLIIHETHHRMQLIIHATPHTYHTIIIPTSLHRPTTLLLCLFPHFHIGPVLLPSLLFVLFQAIPDPSQTQNTHDDIQHANGKQNPRHDL